MAEKQETSADIIAEMRKKDIDVMKAALSAPPRNCDVGTAEEQVGRHATWCEGNANQCLFPKASKCTLCFARWAQMPYKEGGAK